MKRVRIVNGNGHKKNNGQFKKGAPGRPPGTPNKVTTTLKVAALESAAMCGSDKRGSGGLHGFLYDCACRFPKAYLKFLEKIIPLTISGKVDGEVKHKYETVAELRDALKERGLPPPPRMIDITPTVVKERD